MQVSATAMLSICFNGCPHPPLSALCSTSRLTSISKPMPSSSGRSRCAMKRCHNWRLVMFLDSLVGCVRQRLWHLAEQVIIEHLARDRGCRAAAVPAVFGQHYQRDPGLFGRRKSDEPGMIAVPLVDLAGIVFLTLLHGDHLRGTGLAGNMILRSGSGLCRRPTR